MAVQERCQDDETISCLRINEIHICFIICASEGGRQFVMEEAITKRHGTWKKAITKTLREKSGPKGMWFTAVQKRASRQDDATDSCLRINEIHIFYRHLHPNFTCGTQKSANTQIKTSVSEVETHLDPACPDTFDAHK